MRQSDSNLAYDAIRNSNMRAHLIPYTAHFGLKTYRDRESRNAWAYRRSRVSGILIISVVCKVAFGHNAFIVDAGVRRAGVLTIASCNFHGGIVAIASLILIGGYQRKVARRMVVKTAKSGGGEL